MVKQHDVKQQYALPTQHLSSPADRQSVKQPSSLPVTTQSLWIRSHLALRPSYWIALYRL